MLRFVWKAFTTLLPYGIGIGFGFVFFYFFTQVAPWPPKTTPLAAQHVTNVDTSSDHAKTTQTTKATPVEEQPQLSHPVNPPPTPEKASPATDTVAKVVDPITAKTPSESSQATEAETDSIDPVQKEHTSKNIICDKLNDPQCYWYNLCLQNQQQAFDYWQHSRKYCTNLPSPLRDRCQYDHDIKIAQIKATHCATSIPFH
ncbi:hypothetical protein ACQZV8_02200 [Magnetococcales bacterium HHB-1]